MEKAHIQCPKCGQFVDISIDSVNPDSSGLHSLAFIHKDHIFSVYLDQHLFVRGAYIKPLYLAPDTNCYFDGYYVLTKVVVGHKFRFAFLLTKKKIIDIRAFPEVIAFLYDFLEKLSNDNIPNRMGDYTLDSYSMDSIRIVGIRLNNFTIKWLKALAEILANIGPPTEKGLTNALIFLDNNYHHEPKNEDKKKLLEILSQ